MVEAFVAKTVLSIVIIFFFFLKETISARKSNLGLLISQY